MKQHTIYTSTVLILHVYMILAKPSNNTHKVLQDVMDDSHKMQQFLQRQVIVGNVFFSFSFLFLFFVVRYYAFPPAACDYTYFITHQSCST